MGQIDAFEGFIRGMKVTKSDLTRNIVQRGEHRIANRYRELHKSGLYTLVEFDYPTGATLVSDGGIAKSIDSDWLDEQYECVERGLPWLTWRYGPNKPYIHGPLSNFWIEQDGLSLEHRFAALKTNKIEEKLKILNAGTPGAAKKLGRLATLRPGWDEIKRDLMRDLLAKKFLSNYYPFEYLMMTSQCIIREKNNWNDTIWGVNLQNVGRNLLGKELMLLREALNG